MKSAEPDVSWPARLFPDQDLSVVIGRQTQRAMLALADECQDLRDRRILGRKMLHLVEALGKEARAVKQLLIERPYHGEPFAAEFAPFHADDIEAFENRVLAVHEAERNDVAAHAADPADHHLRP